VAQVLVIGGAGFVGSVLCRELLDRGHRVRVLDALLFGAAPLEALLAQPGFSLLAGDTRDARALGEALDGASALVHLGELVGDPACAANEALTRQINGAATRRVIEAAVGSSVRRFVYTSSCSVYGAAAGVVDEASPPDPLSPQARFKLAAEAALLARGGPGFEPVVLRLASLFGLSPRPRFDLFVNQLAARAASGRRVDVFGGGQWRPFLHVRDAARAIACVLEAPRASVAGRVFNVGGDAQNHTLQGVAEAIACVVPEARLVRRDLTPDLRSYRVSFARIAGALGFRPTRDLAVGVSEIVAALRSGQIGDFAAPRFHNQEALADPAVQLRLRRPLGAEEPPPVARVIASRS
jgi:nucleoside-diphosphate-sugar epimerase